MEKQDLFTRKVTPDEDEAGLLHFSGPVKKSGDEAEKAEDGAPKAAASKATGNTLLWAQIILCVFIAAIFFFTARQDGALWEDLARQTKKLMDNGIGFSGQEELTRFSDEVKDFFGNVVTLLRF